MLLNQKNVFVLDSASVLKKIAQLKKDGTRLLHLISDFDFTLTQFWNQGVRGPSTHHVLMNYSRISSDFKEKSETLFKEYYPIEISKRPMDEKKVKMEEWWTKSHELIIKQGISRQMVVEMVQETPLVFRSGFKEFLSFCSTKDIPLLIFSAGITDIIHETLHQGQYLAPNIHIISNPLGFNENQVCDHFSGDLIHVFNKNESHITDSYRQSIEDRKNVILLGDSLGDLHMADGMDHTIKLTIGFLNHDQDTLLDDYSKRYDIVILNDDGLHIVNQLLMEL